MQLTFIPKHKSITSLFYRKGDNSSMWECGYYYFGYHKGNQEYKREVIETFDTEALAKDWLKKNNISKK